MGTRVTMMPFSLWNRAVTPDYVIYLPKPIGNSDQSYLIIVCVRRWGWLMFVWFLLGFGPYLAPALGFLPLPWAGLTIPSGIVQTRLQTFLGKSSSNQVRKLGAERGGPGGPGVAQGGRNGGWEKAQVLSSLGLGFQQL